MPLFGWDLLYNNVKDDIKDNQDVLVCLAHLVIISNGFKCIGLGESKILDGSESKSESLPPKWNENYAIRYEHLGRLYNFKATLMGDAVMMNLVRVDENTVSLLQLNTRSVAKREGILDEMIPDNKNIVDQIKSQLIDQVVVSKKLRDGSSQTDRRETHTTRSEEGIPPSVPGQPNPFRFDPLRDPFHPPMHPVPLGRDDLDPFGGLNPLRDPRGNFPLPGGGGMLFRPPGPSGLPGGNLGVPRGAIPPGARFDPFRPPDVDRYQPRRPRPDNDEFPPPGFDDMFM